MKLQINRLHEICLLINWVIWGKSRRFLYALCHNNINFLFFPYLVCFKCLYALTNCFASNFVMFKVDIWHFLLQYLNVFFFIPLIFILIKTSKAPCKRDGGCGFAFSTNTDGFIPFCTVNQKWLDNFLGTWPTTSGAIYHGNKALSQIAHSSHMLFNLKEISYWYMDSYFQCGDRFENRVRM